MTLATTFMASSHLTTGVQFLLLVPCVIAGLVMLTNAGALPEEGPTRLRVLYALLALVAAVTIYSATTQAATFIACGEDVSWLQWVFWICRREF